jgi:hypothetical protein
MVDSSIVTNHGPHRRPLLPRTSHETLSARYTSKLTFELFMLAKMRAHQAFPQLAVIGRMKMEQFMGNDVILEVRTEL